MDIRAAMFDDTERATHAQCVVEENLSIDRREFPRKSGWRGLPARLFVAYWSVSVAVLGMHGGRVYGSEETRRVWSPHTVLGLGVPYRDIAASSHGLGCEYGCRDQRGRHEGNVGHLFLDITAETKEALSSLL